MALIGRMSAAAKSGLQGSDSGPSPAIAAEGEALELAERLPDLLVEAMRVANTIMHGIHGRRRSGPGETFWQFRQYEQTDDAALIDWRRSASSDHYYVREREWEAAHTFWLWANLSPSMVFRSHLSETLKRDRALVLLLATAEMLVRAGERVAYLGLSRPTASRRATTRMVETLVENQSSAILVDSQPPAATVARHAGIVLVSDFLDPPEITIERMKVLADNGAKGHLIMIADPAEETLPWEGRAEFLALGSNESWLADRVETIREDYQTKLKAHRDQLRQEATRMDWSFLIHHTDRPAAEPLLSLSMRLQDGGRGQFAGLTRGVA